MSTWQQLRATARKLYERGDTVETVARALQVPERKIAALFDAWHVEDALAKAEADAKALRDRAEADEKFRGLADAIRSLAVEVAKGAKSKGVKAEDVLNLAKATELAQRIRARAKG